MHVLFFQGYSVNYELKIHNSVRAVSIWQFCGSYVSHAENSHSEELDLFSRWLVKAVAHSFQATLNIKGYKMPCTFGTSFEEFGAAENFVIGKINNIYSVEMQISLRRGPMNNWVRTITLNNSFLNILQCIFFLWPEGKLSFVTAAMCGSNYAECLCLPPPLNCWEKFLCPSSLFQSGAGL